MLKLLDNLSPSEYLAFLDQQNPGTNTRKLTKLLRVNPSIDRDDVFRRIFKRKRELSNDHLLRNELSILKKKLENFIVSNSRSNVPENSLYHRAYCLGYWCISKGLTDLASVYCDKAFQLAMKVDSATGLLQINKLKLKIIQYGKSDYHQKLNALQELRNDHIQYLNDLIAEEIGFADFIKAGAYKLASNLRKTENSFSISTTHETLVSDSKSRAAKYYRYKSQGYSLQGKAAIEQLNKALIVLQEETEIFDVESERLTCLSAIAMEYALLGELKKSGDTYRSIILHPAFQSFTARNALLFNYCTTLIKLKQYKDALIYIEHLEKEELEPIVKERIYTMKCNCFIFMEDVKGLKSILPQNLQSLDVSVRAYYRFLFTIYYLIKDEDELAERELTNIKKMRGFNETDYAPLLHIFELYVDTYVAQKYREKKFGTFVKKLLTEVKQLHSQHKQISELLPVVWIEQKLDEFTK